MGPGNRITVLDCEGLAVGVPERLDEAVKEVGEERVA
jgi:hypothetical protein